MKLMRALILLLAVRNLIAQTDPGELRPQTRNVAVADAAAAVVTLHLKPGFVSALRLEDAVNSIAVGDPSSFRAEHADGEPELVFFKPLTADVVRSNALIVTRSGEQISVTLISAGDGPEVDFLVNCRRPSRLLLVGESPMLGVAETRALNASTEQGMQEASTSELEEVLKWQSSARFPDRKRGEVEAVVGRSLQRGQEMIVAYSVVNRSESPIELLPPQIELSNADRHGHGRLTSEPLPVSAYRMNARRLNPGERADGVVAFERPAFKESRAVLELRLAQSEQVDHPIVLPLPFLPATTEEMP